MIDTIVTYSNGDKQVFLNRNRLNFWGKCKRIMEVVNIEELRTGL